jgi:hypothetical protein
LLLQFVFWAISVIIIGVMCFAAYSYYKNNQKLNNDYFVLLKQLQENPNNAEIRSRVFESGRRYYKNRQTGIDLSIEWDIKNHVAESNTPN